MGGSVLERTADGMRVLIDEQTSPFPRPTPRRLRGSVLIRGDLREDRGPPIALDEQGEHRWWPVLPRAPIEVDVPCLGLRWRGEGYHDANAGNSPLGQAFSSWSWGRFHTGQGAIVTYDTTPRQGPGQSVALAFEGGRRRELGRSFGASSIARTGWGLPVPARSDVGARPPRLLHSLEDTPFYARHVVETTLLDERARGVTETLSLDRFGSRWVQALLPFRMRRT
jgi:carotenoid 1,2-hydratase